ncbi:MAG: hypothetical protein EPO02_02715 [Nitrospirae bacterium]|nr:MAG: hypothetical protein EPO02_02715 [Nitrospirota bacterium]
MSATASITAPPNPALTREQIEAVIASLQPVQRIMIRLLLLPYMSPSSDDVFFMARERTEPNMRAGGNIATAFGSNADIRREKISGVPKDWIVSVENRARQYQAQLRENLVRLNLLSDFFRDYLAGLQPEIAALEHLLSAECEMSPESLDDLRAQARLSPITYALKKLAARADKQEVEEEDYRRERLSLEYQAHLRRRDRFKKRLDQITVERQAALISSLSDEFLAEVWGLAVGPIRNRRVKAIQAYLSALTIALNASPDQASMTAAVNAGIGPKLAGGSKNEGVSSSPVGLGGDLWSLTVHALAAELMSSGAPKPCMHPESGTKALAAKLRGLATYELGEDDEVKIWTRTVACFNCATALRTAQQGSGLLARQADEVLAQVTTRTAMPRKEVAEAVPEKAKDVPEETGISLEERLRPWIGDDAGETGGRGSQTWW